MAKVVKSEKGYYVAHSTNGMMLTGVFRGRGAKKRAQKMARKICRRNMSARRCRR